MQHDLIDTSTGQPKMYYLAAVLCLWLGEWIKTLDSYHIPEVVMQLFQILAWGATIIACIIGVCLNWRNKNKKYHDPN